MTRTVTLPATDGAPWRIYSLSDAHIGSALCDEDALQHWLDTIARDDHGRCVITGDLIAAIGKGDRRLDLGSLAPWVRDADPAFVEDVIEVQSQRAVELLEPIADKVDGFVDGNHERKPRAWYGRAVGANICRDLGIRDAYLGAQGWLCYSFKVTKTRRRRLSLYLHHGYSAGRTVGAQIAMLERALGRHDCDMVMCGHSHELFALPFPRMGLDGKTGRLQQHNRWGIMAGTFERSLNDGSDTWHDEKALSPKPIGGVIIEYNPATVETEVQAKVVA